MKKILIILTLIITLLFTNNIYAFGVVEYITEMQTSFGVGISTPETFNKEEFIEGIFKDAYNVCKSYHIKANQYKQVSFIFFTNGLKKYGMIVSPDIIQRVDKMTEQEFYNAVVKNKLILDYEQVGQILPYIYRK